MNEDRKLIIKQYKGAKRAVKTRERLDDAGALLLVFLFVVWAFAAVFSVGFVLWFFWTGGLGFVSIALALLGIGGLVWTLLDRKNKKDLEDERQRKIRANWRD